MQENLSAGDKHAVTVENQQRANLTGIVSVESFNEKQVSIKTMSSYLVITGENLNVSKFNTDNGTLVIDGKINEIRYSEKGKAAGVIKKLFK
jgi:sporulation protein YabP